jgi:hypothetical protein
MTPEQKELIDTLKIKFDEKVVLMNKIISTTKPKDKHKLDYYAGKREGYNQVFSVLSTLEKQLS